MHTPLLDGQFFILFVGSDILFSLVAYLVTLLQERWFTLTLV